MCSLHFSLSLRQFIRSVKAWDYRKVAFVASTPQASRQELKKKKHVSAIKYLSVYNVVLFSLS